MLWILFPIHCALTLHTGSDWSSLSVYEPELVHDIIDSEEEVYEDEDDSNGKSHKPCRTGASPANVFSLACLQMSLTGVMTTQVRKSPHTAVSLRETGMTIGTGRLTMV